MIIRPATVSDLRILAELARTAWLTTYPGIISEGQIHYMLGKMYAPATIAKELEGGQITWLIGQRGDADSTVQDQELALQHYWGYAAFGPHPAETQVARLHKLYLNPAYKGMGLGKRLLQEVIQYLPDHYQFLELNVNKKNPAYHFYLSQGFTIRREEVLDIGQGYVMDDYVLWRPLVQD